MGFKFFSCVMIAFGGLLGSNSCEEDKFFNPLPPDCLSQDTAKILFDPNFSVKSNFEQTITIKDRTANPLLIADKPWESKSINYANVLRVDGKWQMWYEAYDENSNGDFDAHICYAESQDGIVWTKPNLQVISYKGSKNNNIIISGDIHGMSVFYDSLAPMNSRYKIVFIKTNTKDNSWIYGMSSSDGIHFNNLVLLLKQNSDTQNTIIADRGKYRLYTRWWDGGRVLAGRRTIAYSENKSFGGVCFPTSVEILSLDAPYGKDLYNNASTKLKEDLYVMFPSIFDQNTDLVIPYVALSQNGLNFKLQGTREFISLGSGFDSKGIYVSPGAVRGESANEFIFYYLGRSFPHSMDTHSNSYEGGIGRFTIEIQ